MPQIMENQQYQFSKLPGTEDVLEVARRINWYKQPDQAIEDVVDFLAHLMTFGRPEDVEIIARHLNREDFRKALELAPPGILDARSWSYWNLLLGRTPVPPMPVRNFKLEQGNLTKPGL